MRLQALLLTLPVTSVVCGIITNISFPYPIDYTCNCLGTNDTGKMGAPYICNDHRLGPKKLPRTFPLLSFVTDYDRFGGLTPGTFLKKWTNPTTGRWLYPEQNGFYLDVHKKPIKGNMTLQAGAKVDRFGAEKGTFLAPADAPYAQRALPPQSLNTDTKAPDYPYEYHIYNVTKPFLVAGGPVAPAFEQPGLGAQFDTNFTGDNTTIAVLIEGGYLKPLNLSQITLGPGPDKCGS